ncbi:AMP-binding protein [Streptosporangium sp. NPDC006013]|uniref:AMP-binding protein n=1 Tax=Streptosporangium sp. NPDC006013 TaxID=3155596 RepID=UPI0033B9B855
MTSSETSAEPLAPGTPFVTAIRHFAELRPDEVVVIDHNGSTTRRELESRTNRLARAYAQLGVRPGDLVTIGLPNGIPFVESMLAVWKLGATPQPVSHRLPPAELAAIIEVAGSTLVVGLETWQGGASVPADFEPPAALSDEPLPIVISRSWKAPTSGGSTGTPKIIMSTAPATVDALIPLMPLLHMPVGGVKLTTTPLSHNMGVMFTTAPLITGGVVVIAPRFDAAATLDLIDRYHVDWSCLVPTMLHRIARLPEDVRAAADLSSVVSIATGGAMCPPWLKSFWVDWLGAEKMLEFYATTETHVVVIADGHDWMTHPGTVGRVRIGELEVRDEEGSPVPDGTVGELWVRRGASAPPSYAYRGAVAHADADGWESVGDMGSLDDGWLYLADRKADMITVGGSNVYAAEVEGALEAHPRVISSCVFGLPDDEYGNILHAVVQSALPVSDQELIDHLRSRLLPYKVPRLFEHTTLPIRDDAGKVRRSLLRQQTLTARGPAA